ncbi:MAG: hypothetical protein HY820_34495 [Acidobacteria bacterium]|nr:hypothetical protein [Acidobacteriota bacterium]
MYVAAFAPQFKATIVLDPHIAVNGGTNWYAPWYLDWLRPFPDIRTEQHTVLSLLNPDSRRPGFEHDHHELMALAAPRPLLLIGGARRREDCGAIQTICRAGVTSTERERCILGWAFQRGFSLY